jgi:putative acetyltransferase
VIAIFPQKQGAGLGTQTQNMIKIKVALSSEYESLLVLWENSVLRTHHFLTPLDIAFLKPNVLEGFSQVELFCAEDGDRTLGFIGILKDKIEMLFVTPDELRRGVGSCLVNFAVESRAAKFVDVNEQNDKAVLFYRHMGFEIFACSEYDSFGKAFPILHMGLMEN